MGEYRCYKQGCHARICLDAAVEERLQRTHETFYCTAGHGNAFIGKSPQEKRIDELAAEVRRLQTRVDWLNEMVQRWRLRSAECPWSGCDWHPETAPEYTYQRSTALHMHLVRAHGMPTLGAVRAEEAG